MKGSPADKKKKGRITMQGLDDEIKEEDKVVNLEEKKTRRPFAYWTVGGKEYRLKLSTSVICQLEDKFKCNLMNLLAGSGGMPSLSVMLTITQGAMKNWEHGIKYADVQELFDRYCEEGGTQLSFMTDVLMEIYRVSGFFSETQQEAMDQKLEEMKEIL